ncbi:MAG TPA: hypothetical protein VNO32_54145 [Candidatus Acidoferrum sp.]|jgi:hypothetical protein|nr:hypothetical protein [Candidatus Acidoferrum sp.]
MPTQASILRKQYATALAAWSAAFPDIQPPAASWWQVWFKENEHCNILEAIRVLQRHSAPVRARYTADSLSRAVTALLREIALRRAIPLSAPPSGDSGAQS